MVMADQLREEQQPLTDYHSLSQRHRRANLWLKNSVSSENMGGGSSSNLDPLVYGMKGIYGQQTRLYSTIDTINAYKYFKLSHKPTWFAHDGTTQTYSNLPNANTWYETSAYPCTSYWNMQIATNADVYITFSNSDT